MLASSEGRHIGLSATAAREALARDGPNELPREARRTLLRLTLEVVREPMLAMLLVAGGVYLLLGDTGEALVLILFAEVSVGLTIVQERRTDTVLEALRDLSAPRALVIRDGTPVRVPGREVVVGDVVVLEQGDRVAADARVLEAANLECDEALLTGESVPVRKCAAAGEADDLAGEPGGEDRPWVYAGAIVTRGNGLARVSATGSRSQIGQIGRSLAGLEPEAPRLQRETNRLVRLAAAAGLSVAALVTLLYGVLRGGWLEALLAGIATAMSLLPEEFPVVLTIFLAMGSWRIARAGVLTRRAAAIEMLGAATVLCTDKTGTLTQNRMAVVAARLPDGSAADLPAAWADPRFHALLRHGALASAPVPVDPMEVAFHAAAQGAGERDAPPPGDGWALVHTTGLAPELMAMSNVWQTGDGGDSLLAAAKGAPEAIAVLCDLDAAAAARLERAAQAMAAEGMRVIGVASARPATARATSDHREHRFDLLGLIGLADPLRPGVRDAVAQCRTAGVRVVMITGDYPATARAIAADAGLATGAELTGPAIAAMAEDELARAIRGVSICARTQPAQKLRIVEAFKAGGEVVAMTGDGVNDAPALKAAHIGIAMGKRGTDVAREAAALVLVDDQFEAIVTAIRLGRRIYDNIRRAVGFILAVHVPIAGLALLPLLLGMPIVLGPLQIALLELIIDPVCAIVFEAEDEERGIMDRPPRPPAERLFSRALVVGALAEGAAALAMLGAVLVLGDAAGIAAPALRTMVFLALVATVIVLVLARRPAGKAGVNRAFLWVLAGVGTGVAVILASATAQHWLGFAPLAERELAMLGSGPVALLAGLRAVRLIGRGWTRRRKAA